MPHACSSSNVCAIWAEYKFEKEPGVIVALLKQYWSMISLMPACLTAERLWIYRYFYGTSVAMPRGRPAPGESS